MSAVQAALVLGIVQSVMVVVEIRQSRRYQRRRFTRRVRSLDHQMSAKGWTIVLATFKPGLLTGHGRIEWAQPGVDGHAYAEVPVRAPTVRELLAGDTE